jgi:hypothetical protein
MQQLFPGILTLLSAWVTVNHAANLCIVLAVMHCVSALRVSPLKLQRLSSLGNKLQIITVPRKQDLKSQLEMAGIGFASLALTAFRHREEIP